MPYTFEMTSDVLEIGSPRYLPDFDADIYRKLYMAEELTEAEIAALPRRVEISMHGDMPVAPDFINAAGPAIVSARVAGKVRALEPGRHRFVPVEVVWAATGASCGDYSFMLVTEAVDHFDYDRTAWLTKVNGGFGMAAAIDSHYRLAIGYNAPCVLRREAIEGRHIWRGAPEGTRKIFFCSDPVRDFAQTNKLRGARFIEVGIA
ncbi:hypothetical protein KHP62_12475 [Rhodobacteraceae bacterium NNCM2]|nr:hypothetical protein [Coraliihabitans acroporae]